MCELESLKMLRNFTNELTKCNLSAAVKHGNYVCKLFFFHLYPELIQENAMCLLPHRQNISISSFRPWISQTCLQAEQLREQRSLHPRLSTDLT